MSFRGLPLWEKIEQRIIGALNDRNPEWKIEGCKYIIDRDNFSLAPISSYIGLIASEQTISKRDVPKSQAI